MGTVAEHEKRSQEIADTTRRVLVTLNGGGIAVVFTIAGTLAKDDVNASWAIKPVAFFVAGLLITVISLLLAKHRELKRRDAAAEGKDDPEKFKKKLYWKSFTWDFMTLSLFGIGAIVGLLALSSATGNA